MSFEKKNESCEQFKAGELIVHINLIGQFKLGLSYLHSLQLCNKTQNFVDTKRRRLVSLFSIRLQRTHLEKTARTVLTRRLCPLTFYSQQGMTQHVKNYHDEKKYFCTISHRAHDLPFVVVGGQKNL